MISYRTTLLSGALTGAAGVLASIAMPTAAAADSVCTYNTGAGTYTCTDATPTPAVTASGAFTPGSTAGAGDGVNLSNAGALAATLIGTINTTGAGEDGVNLVSGGALTYTGTGSTTSATGGALQGNYLQGVTGVTASTGAVALGAGAGSTGVYAYNTGAGNISVTTQGITGTGAGSVGVYSQNIGAGNSAITGGTVSVTGAGSIGLYSIAANGNSAVTGTSTTVGGTGTGIISTATNGTSTVTTGTVAAGTGSLGVVSNTITGATCGANSVTVNGGAAGTGVVSDLTAIQANSCGTTAVTVNAGRVVTSANAGAAGTIAINGGTTSTTTINGSVSAGTAANTAINVTGQTTSNTVTIGSGGSVTGTFDGSAVADTLTIAAGGTLATSGTSDFQAGADAVNINGTVNTSGASGFANLETLAIGTTGLLNLAGNTFTLTGTTSFTNAGIIRAEAGTTNIVTPATLTNTGNIDLQDGAANDVLTITGNYSGGTGATLSIDENGTTADRLVVTGSVAGTTAVNVQNTGGLAFNPAGILVVDAGTSSANAFVIGNNTGNGLFVYDIEQVGADYYLTIEPGLLAFAPLAVGNLAQDMWYQGTDTYLSYAAARRADGPNAGPFGFWGLVYASRDRYGDDETATIAGVDYEFDNEINTKRYGAQMGADLRLGGMGALGLTVGYQNADAEGDVADTEAEGYNVGVYGMFGGPVGAYAGILFKHDNNDYNSLVTSFDGRKSGFKSNGIDGEVGYRFPSGSMTLDIQAGVSHVNTKIDDFRAGGATYDFDKVTSTRGRLGARANLAGDWNPFVEGKLFHEFSGDSDIVLSDALNDYDVDTRGRGTWGRLEAGVAALNGLMASIWGEAGDVQGIGGRLGFRFGGSAEPEMPEAPATVLPPPAPVAAPPATQTCADGSVILATDVCPAAPQPAPAPVERG